MKDDSITKMYAGLTDQERGKLGFTYLTQGNTLEQKRIASVMTDQYFVGLPDGYRRMFINLNNLSMTYAIAYWNQVAITLASMGGATAMLHRADDAEQWKPMIECFEAAEARLLGIETAFDDVCQAHGLDRDVMRFSACKQFYTIATPDLMPDDVYMEGMREVFASMLEA